MKEFYFLYTLTFCCYSYLTYSFMKFDPRFYPSRVFAGACALTAAWILVFFVFGNPAGGDLAEAWYRHNRFSWPAKSVFYLLMTLGGTGQRKRLPRWILVLLFAFGAFFLCLGLLDILNFPTARIAERAVAGYLTPYIAYGPSLILLYSVPLFLCFVASALLMRSWRKIVTDKRLRKIASLYMGIIAAMCVITPLEELLPLDAIWKTLLSQAIQLAIAFGVFYCIHRYQLPSPTPTMAGTELFEAVSDPAIIINRLGVVLMENQAAEKLLGPLNPDDGKAVPIEGEKLQEALDLIVAGQSPSRELNLVFINGTGERELMRVTVSAILDKWRELAGFLLIGRAAGMPDEVKQRFGLSKREKEVYLLLVSGYSNQEMADRLFISPGTVKNHIHSIYEKTGAANRLELSRFLV
jgi:DNA-binding CsgD family transcriptional regulator